MPDPEPSCRIALDNVIDPLRLDGHFAHPGRPVEVDMGCGKGRFLLARAARCPDVNFLGVDRMLGRLRKIDRRARRTGLDNVRLLRMDAYYATTYLLPARSIRTYYILFPDPWPKVRHHRHRLFNAAYMDALHRTLEDGGTVHAATDHLPYFGEIASIVRDDPRFEIVPPWLPAEDERTDFELMFIAERPIGRLSFRKRGA